MSTSTVWPSALADVRHPIKAQIPKREADVTALEAELREVCAEQKRLAQAVALADDVPAATVTVTTTATVTVTATVAVAVAVAVAATVMVTATAAMQRPSP